MYYNKNGIVIRRSIKSDVDKFKDALRQADIDEVYASHHHNPEEAVRMSIEKTIFCCTAENAKPIAIFGINPDALLGNKAVIWMLATDELDKYKKTLMSESKKFVKMMLEYYPYLYNYIDIRNAKTINWLKWLGAKFENAKPYGVENKLFQKFVFERKQ